MANPIFVVRQMPARQAIRTDFNSELSFYKGILPTLSTQAADCVRSGSIDPPGCVNRAGRRRVAGRWAVACVLCLQAAGRYGNFQLAGAADVRVRAGGAASQDRTGSVAGSRSHDQPRFVSGSLENSRPTRRRHWRNHRTIGNRKSSASSTKRRKTKKSGSAKKSHLLNRSEAYEQRYGS